MHTLHSSLIFILLTGLMACTSTKSSMTSTKPEEEVEVRDLDTLVVSEPSIEKNTNEQFPPSVYRASQTRTIDLIHTKLALSFDYEKEHVLGEAWIDFTPIFDPVQSFTLDAQYFDIHAIRDENGRTIDYSYLDSTLIVIQWPEVIDRNDTLQVYIDYTAVPGRKPAGGSQAISSNKGLFFINARGTIPNKPTQIWTQGETEHNSNWFPTLDQPNARCSQEVILNVPLAFETLSNGKLIKSEVLNDSIRQDHWLQELPHAPYLFMLAIGDFAVVRDQWEDIPLAYYVEHNYKEDAPSIFNHTPEMLAVFSDMLDYKYPWAKYDQVVVRDYVSGAMENTTGVIFGDFVQKHKLDLVGNDNDFIVAHEMFHHWFGDLVTCESWSNLTMNEGFATYSEYLWKEYKFGKSEADLHRANQLSGYMAEARQNKRPIVDFEYVRPESMFDAHSYNKGGLVLHMLRDYLGSDKFFAGLNLYLERHAYTAVETHDLRLAMEDVSGEDLNWFFNQWFFEAGHPQLQIRTAYLDGECMVTVEQTQDAEKEPAIFTLPTEVDFYTSNGERKRIPFTIDKRVSTLRTPLAEAPALIVFDPRDILLAEVSMEKSDEAYAMQFKRSASLKHRREALKNIAAGALKTDLLKRALTDEHWSVRRDAVLGLNSRMAQEKISLLKTLARSDSNVNVRRAALKKMSELSTVAKDDIIGLCKERIEAKEAGVEMAAALAVWYDLDSARALQKAQALEPVRSQILDKKIAEIYAKTGDPGFISFLDQLLPQQSGFNSFPFFNAYSDMVSKLRGKALLDRVDALAEIGLNQNGGMFTRYGATKAIADIRSELESTSDVEPETLESIQQILDDIVRKETSPRLKAMYSRL